MEIRQITDSLSAERLKMAMELKKSIDKVISQETAENMLLYPVLSLSINKFKHLEALADIKFVALEDRKFISAFRIIDKYYLDNNKLYAFISKSYLESFDEIYISPETLMY